MPNEHNLSYYKNKIKNLHFDIFFSDSADKLSKLNSRRSGDEFLDLLKKWAHRNVYCCVECGTFNQGREIADPDGDPVCRTCFDERYFHCRSCESPYNYRERCIFDGDYYCQDCYDEEFFSCTRCGIELPQADAYHNDDGDSYCGDCYERDEDDDDFEDGQQNRDGIPLVRHVSPIHRSHTENVLHHKTEGREHDYKDNLTLGVELECEDYEDTIAAAKKCLEYINDFAIIKHDGSLQNGFEIVAVPMGLKEAKERFKPMFDNRPKSMRSYDTGRCGMHVHVGRASMSCNSDFGKYESTRWSELSPFSNMRLLETKGAWGESYFQMWKIWKFLSSENNYNFVRKIAQRSLKPPKKAMKQPWHRWEAGNYASVAPDLILASKREIYGQDYGTSEDEIPTPKSMFKSHNRAYLAFNWGTAKPTVEYRLFQGTLFYPSFCKNLEFAHALTKFTMPARQSFQDSLSVNNFLRFVEMSKSVNADGSIEPTYPFLVSFLRSKGFLRFKKTVVLPNKMEEVKVCA